MVITRKLFRETLEQVLKTYLVPVGRNKTTWDINNGDCAEYAADVFELLGGETSNLYGIWLEDLDDDGPNHYAIFWNGRWYDAECLDGVKDWHDLPITLNMGRTRAEVLADREAA